MRSSPIAVTSTRRCCGALDGADAALVVLGLHHEQQHQELILTDIKHAFWMNPLRPSYAPAPAERVGGDAADSPLAWCERAGGTVEIGAPAPDASGEPFAFDNERPRHAQLLRPHALASRLVTCGEYRAFIADGGYRRPELWLSDGWDAAQAGGWAAPLYWEQRDGEHWSLTLAGMRPVRAAEPVSHVSYYEADAYARWAQARLPTETEWEAAATAAAPATAGVPNLLETGWLRPIPAAPRCGQRRDRAALRRCLGVDAEPVHALSRISRRRRRRRRVQRQVHVQSDGAARRVLSDAAHARARELPQLLPARRTLADVGNSPRPRRVSPASGEGGPAGARRPKAKRILSRPLIGRDGRPEGHLKVSAPMSASAFRRSRGGDPFATGESLLRELLDEQAGLLQQVSRLRSSQPQNDYDDLTGLGTRRYFEARVIEELSRAERNPSYTGSMLLLDVDDLAAARAQYGPTVGDRGLRWVAKVLRESLRVGDVVCRGGGDRFMAVLCDTPSFDTGEVISRVRGQITRVRGHRWSAAAISIGTAAWPDDAFTLPALTAIAAVRLLEDRQRRHAQARPQLILLP